MGLLFEVVRVSFELTAIVVGAALFFIYAPRYTPPEVVVVTPNVEDTLLSEEDLGDDTTLSEEALVGEETLFDEKTLENKESLFSAEIIQSEEIMEAKEEKTTEVQEEVEKPVELDIPVPDIACAADVAEENMDAVKFAEPFTLTILSPPALLPAVPVMTVSDVTFNLLQAQVVRTSKVFKLRKIAMLEERDSPEQQLIDEKRKRAKAQAQAAKGIRSKFDLMY